MNEELRDAFLNRLLPFGEYIVAVDKHHLYKGQFGDTGAFDHSYHAGYVFPNGHRASLVTGPVFHCTSSGPYELWWETMNNPQHDGIFGYLNDEQLMLKLAEIFSQPTYEQYKQKE